MINILTVCAGQEPEGVWHLHRGIERHCPEPFRFICLNDVMERRFVKDGIEWWPFKHDWPGHFAKVEMWRPDLEELGRILYLDTSCVITGDMSPLLAYQGDFCVVRDFYWHTPCQSVVSFTPGAGRAYYETFCQKTQMLITLGDSKAVPNFFDQVLMNVVPRGGPIDYWPEGVVVSYKINGPQQQASVVKFHGKPKPEDSNWAKDQRDANIGFPFAPGPNIPNPSYENVVSSIKRGFPQSPLWKNKKDTVRLVGWDEPNITAVKEDETDLIASVDYAGRWLNNHGITPDIAVLVEPYRIPEAKSYYVSSACPPDIFDALEGKDVCLFHPGGDPEVNLAVHLHYLERQTDGFYVAITRSNTPFLCALEILNTGGYHYFSIHGFNPSGNMGTITRVNGQEFRCTKLQNLIAREFVELCRCRGEHLRLRIRGGGIIAEWLKMSERLGWINS